MNTLLRISNYIARYAPSERKLKEYLSRKNHTEDFFRIVTELGYTESLMIEIWLRTFLSLSKGEKEIREKLRKKGFQKELIDKKIEKVLVEISDWESHRSSIERKIDDLLLKGKSKKMVYVLLREKYPYFRENIGEILEEKNEKESLRKEVEKYLGKYDISNYQEKSKFYAALIRKGFEYRAVDTYLRETHSDTE